MWMYYSFYIMKCAVTVLLYSCCVGRTLQGKVCFMWIRGHGIFSQSGTSIVHYVLSKKAEDMFTPDISGEYYRKLLDPAALWYNGKLYYDLVLYTSFFFLWISSWSEHQTWFIIAQWVGTWWQTNVQELHRLELHLFCLPLLPKSASGRMRDYRAKFCLENKLLVLPCDVCLQALLTWVNWAVWC